MSSISKYLSGKENSLGQSEVKLRVYVYKNNYVRCNSGIWVIKERWSKKNTIQIPKINSTEKDHLIETKELLDKLVLEIENAVNTNPDKDRIDKKLLDTFIADFHKRERKAKQEQSKSVSSTINTKATLLELMQRYLDEKKLSDSRKKHIKTLMRSLRRYELYQKELGKRNYILYLDKLQPTDLESIQEFLGNERQIQKKYPKIYEAIPYYTKDVTKTPKLRSQKKEVIEKREPKDRGLNYVSDLLIRFRSFVIWANNVAKITTNNPFDSFSIPEPVYGSPVYITLEERDQLYKTDMSDNPALERQRDIFIFHCYLGCRVSDLKKLTRMSVVNGAIMYVARKTKDGNPVTIEVPLSPTAKEILEKYADPNRESLLPTIEPQKYNDAIKEAFRKAGINRTVIVLDQNTREQKYVPISEVASSHMARRTFIGNIYKQVKDPNLVGSLSGHKEGSKAFARYRDIDREMKEELVGLLK